MAVPVLPRRVGVAAGVTARVPSIATAQTVTAAATVTATVIPHRIRIPIQMDALVRP